MEDNTPFLLEMMKHFQQLEAFFLKNPNKTKTTNRKFGRFTDSIHNNHFDLEMLPFSHEHKKIIGKSLTSCTANICFFSPNKYPGAYL